MMEQRDYINWLYSSMLDVMIYLRKQTKIFNRAQNMTIRSHAVMQFND